VLAGDDPASRVYVDLKQKAAKRLGMESISVSLPGDGTQAGVEQAVADRNADRRVDAFLLQLPPPDHLDATAMIEAADPAEDGDGLHPTNPGRLTPGMPGLLPATPRGVLRMLDYYGIETSGANVVVIGRSCLVGRPLAIMLGLKRCDANVTLARS